MTHRAKIDGWVAAAMFLGCISPLVGAKLWITIPLFLGVGICGYPQCYETTDRGLVIHAGLIRRVIPYEAITFIGPSGEDGFNFALSLDHVTIKYGKTARVMIAPSAYDTFLDDMAARTPHLTRRGQDLFRAYA